MQYDVIIIGAGPGGIFSAYELSKLCPEKKIAVFEEGQPLEKRKCPIDGKTVKHCIGCPTCAIMNGFGGAGAFSDGKYNLTNDFGGTLYEYIGKKQAMELMHYVDEINVSHGGENTKLYSTTNSAFKTKCLQCNLHLLDASVRHLGTDINFVVLKNLFAELEPKVDFHFRTPVRQVLAKDGGYEIVTDNETYTCSQCIVSVGRSGSKWMESVCKDLAIETKSNRVDIGVRVELPAEIFKHLTDELYESKIVYKTEKYQDLVRTFCMNPKGAVVTENTNGIVTVNGHSYEDPAKQTENTNFALLVSKHFTEPFKDSNGYGESIARLSNMLGGGVMVQRFGDLIRGQRSTPKRIDKSFVTPTLSATPGDLSLVIPPSTRSPPAPPTTTRSSMVSRSSSTTWRSPSTRTSRPHTRACSSSATAAASPIPSPTPPPAASTSQDTLQTKHDQKPPCKGRLFHLKVAPLVKGRWHAGPEG